MIFNTDIGAGVTWPQVGSWLAGCNGGVYPHGYLPPHSCCRLTALDRITNERRRDGAGREMLPVEEGRRGLSLDCILDTDFKTISEGQLDLRKQEFGMQDSWGQFLALEGECVPMIRVGGVEGRTPVFYCWMCGGAVA